MNEHIEQAIEDRIQEISVEKLRLEQALALIRGGSPMAKAAAATATVVPKKKAIPAGQGKSPAAKRRKQWRASKPMPWKPAPHALPHTIDLYALMADGIKRTSEEIMAALKANGHDISNDRVKSSLQHMRQTGRLMHQGQFWRRKYKHAAKEPAVEVGGNGMSGEIPSDVPKDAAIQRMDELVAEGLATKEERAGVTIYNLPRPAPVVRSS